MINRARPWLTGLVAVSVLLAASAAGSSPAAAAAPAAPAAFSVNTTTDLPANFNNDPNFTVCHTTSNSICSLRAAVMNANRHLGGAVITLPAGTYVLSVPRSAQGGDGEGGLLISNTVTLNGAGLASTIISGTAFAPVFTINAQGAATLSGLTIRNGKATFDPTPLVSDLSGGGIENLGQLNLSDSLLTNNLAHTGGGALFNSGGATATLTRVTLTANHTLVNDGGGIENDGTLTLNDSTVDHNQAASKGGGVYNTGAALTVFNSTLSNNSANVDGGGLDNAGTALVLNATIAGNLADSDGQFGGLGGGIHNGGTLQLANSLLAENYISNTLNNCNGSINSQDYNLAPLTVACSLTGLTSHNITNNFFPRLGELADNGGSTQTRALLAGSPALDKIPAGLNGPCRDPGGAAPVPDQRGVARPVNGLCDIGAYEGEQDLSFFSHNLIPNGDAEAAAGSPQGVKVGVPIWSVTAGKFTAVPYNSPGGFPSVPTDTVPFNHGANFFAGGYAPESDGTVLINVRSIASLIDTGRVEFVFSADLGGFFTDDDHARADISFLDDSLSQVGVGRVLGPVSAAERHNQTKLLHKFAASTVPIHTREILVQLNMTLAPGCPGCFNDGYADNISVVLTPPPLFLPLLAR